MNRHEVCVGLLEHKLNDYKLNSANMPGKISILNNLFAQSLGRFAGRTLSVYAGMYHQIQEGIAVPEIKKSVREDITDKSKMIIKLPFLDPIRVRICGLVALNYSGFLDSEVDFCSALVNDLESRTNDSNLIEQVSQIGRENPAKYDILLRRKQQSLYDFCVLMGFTKDEQRFNQLRKTMHGRIADYFKKVKAMHTGGRLGICWPLPLKNFSMPIREGLSKDIVAHTIQEGISKDYGFSEPNESNYKLIIGQIKETLQYISSKKSPMPAKLNALRLLPTSLFYLVGTNAYADMFTEFKEKMTEQIVGSSMVAASTAGTTAHLADDNPGVFTSMCPILSLTSFLG